MKLLGTYAIKTHWILLYGWQHYTEIPGEIKSSVLPTKDSGQPRKFNPP
jgi:hypothetical protein